MPKRKQGETGQDTNRTRNYHQNYHLPTARRRMQRANEQMGELDGFTIDIPAKRNINDVRNYPLVNYHVPTRPTRILNRGHDFTNSDSNNYVRSIKYKPYESVGDDKLVLGLPHDYNLRHYNQSTPRDLKIHKHNESQGTSSRDMLFGKRFHALPDSQGTSVNHLNVTIGDCKANKEICEGPDATPPAARPASSAYRR